MGYIFDAMNRSDGDDRPNGKAEAHRDPAGDLLADALDATGSDASDAGGAAELANHAIRTPQPILGSPLPGGEAQREGAEGEADESAQHLRLATTVDAPPGTDDRLVVLTEPASITAEEYRAIRTSMLARWKHRRHLVHTITSATPQEGKTITSLNLGLSLAELRNRKTVVVEADLRMPQFGVLLGESAAGEQVPGLISYLRGEKPLSAIIHRLGETGLFYIPAGGCTSNDAVQLLSSTRMSNLLKVLRQQFDHVIVDTPPVVDLADAGILGAQSDDVLLIVRMLRTPRTLVEQAVRTLTSYNAPVAGMIATDHAKSRGRYYYRYGYRRYGHRSYAKAA